MTTEGSSLGTPAVEVEDLVVVRGHTRAVDRVSFSVRGGEVTGLIGPSGSGKTTLMRAMVGVQILASGTVAVLGQPAGSKGLRHRVGYVTQEPSIYDDLTVVETLRFFARVLGVDDAEVDRCIGLVELEPQRKQAVRDLSGGERSRANLAVALLGGPRSWSWTSPPSAWTRCCAASCGPCSTISPQAGRASSSQATSWTRPSVAIAFC